MGFCISKVSRERIVMDLNQRLGFDWTINKYNAYQAILIITGMVMEAVGIIQPGTANNSV